MDATSRVVAMQRCGRSTAVASGAESARVIRFYVATWDSTKIALRADPSVARIVRAWRTLTARSPRDAQRRTVVACSGGADSCALLIALVAAGHPGALVVGHIQHDMRPFEEASADAAIVRSLAERLGVVYVQTLITGAGLPGNAEHNYRQMRYAALGAIAKEHNCGWIATGHHADDQLETVIMRLMRGAGPRALAGMKPSRKLSIGRDEHNKTDGIRLIRPMLETAVHADAERICTLAGVTPVTDRTNFDERLLRAKVRAKILPALREIRPDVSLHASETLTLLRGAGQTLERLAREICDRAHDPHARRYIWDRASLRVHTLVIISEVLRYASAVLGADGAKFTARTLLRAARCIRDTEVHPRALSFAGLRLTVTARTVTLESASPAT
jgi:tRNA(Ile)-lysidine synthetase-like protein